MAQEKPDHTTYRVSASLHDMRKTFLHVWSLAVVLMIATILGLLGPFQTQAHAAEVAMSIFQVSGTMVALVLPAAELANSFITKFSDELLLKIMGQNVPAGQKADVLMEISEELRNNLTPGWRASIYALSSFLLSCIVMFVPTMSMTLRSLSFSPGYFLLGLSLGFVMVGAFWFFPTARYIFRLEVLKDINRIALGLGGSSKKKPEI